MDRLRVLLANELRSYRQTMAITLRALRPNADVVDVEPEALAAEVNRLCPHVVLCSRTTPAVRRLVPAWVELYREHDASVSYVSVRGERSKIVGGMELDELPLSSTGPDPFPLTLNEPIAPGRILRRPCERGSASGRGSL